jgi:hypothetical protein
MKQDTQVTDVFAAAAATRASDTSFVAKATTLAQLVLDWAPAPNEMGLAGDVLDWLDSDVSMRSPALAAVPHTFPGHAHAVYHISLPRSSPRAREARGCLWTRARARNHRARRARRAEAGVERAAVLRVHKRHALCQDGEHVASGRHCDHRADPGQSVACSLNC